MTPERKVKQIVKQKLKKAGFWFFFPVAGRGVAGIPDVIACSPKGRFVAIECKADGGAMTPLQHKVMLDILDHDGMFLTVWPHNMDDLVTMLELLS